MLRIRFVILTFAASAFAFGQQGWSAAKQEARIKREDDAFARHLPKDPAKRQHAMAVYLSQPYGERILAGWRPAYETTTTPHELKPKTGVNIAGRWAKKHGPFGAAFRITKAGRGYDVKFATWDGKGSEAFFRKGVLKGSVLQLDRAVFDDVNSPFSKIYVVMAGKEPRLLASSDVRVLDKLCKTTHRAEAIAGLTYHRA